MEKQIKSYKVDALDSEIECISLVEFPAIDSFFVYMNKQQDRQNLSAVEEGEKRMLYGPVLIPDIKIYRYNELTGEEYNLVFTAKAIETLSKKFMTEARNRNWTTEHEAPTDRLAVVESWIKVGDMDKSVSLGLDVPAGTWIAGVSVDDNEIWEKVKQGEYRGFSIEAFLSLDDLYETFKKEEKVEKNSKLDEIWGKLKNIFSEYLSTTSMQAEEEPAVEEEVKEELEAEEPQEEQEQVEETVEEQPQEEPAVEEPVEEEVVEQPEPEEEKRDEEKEKLEAQIASLEAKIKELQETNEKLSKQPSAEPIQINGKKNSGNYRDMLEAIANRM